MWLLQGDRNHRHSQGVIVATDSLEPKVIEIIATQLSLRDEDIKPTSRFVDDLGADSLDIVELIMEMEEEFDIEIPDEDVEKMLTVKDVTDYIARVVSVE
ncbi:MAG: acyl carrier protein [Deltaproteobacteria bacterium]|nr:acyl carrier protein [Deltaproteobacteria bacterium]